MSSTEMTRAAETLRGASRAVVFTGAGISVESGIPPFRGDGGLWSQVDPSFIEIGYFHHDPAASWRKIKEIFYDFMGAARPNAAHEAVAALERAGHVSAVVTQNIDNLHQEAGSRTVHEFHGTTRRMDCLHCGASHPAEAVSLDALPPRCPRCGGLVKPGFVFFGEAIPEEAAEASLAATEAADVMVVIGTTGEVMPACRLPYLARQAGATVVEVNVAPSLLTGPVSDIFLRGPATAVMAELADAVLGARD